MRDLTYEEVLQRVEQDGEYDEEDEYYDDEEDEVSGQKQILELIERKKL